MARVHARLRWQLRHQLIALGVGSVLLTSVLLVVTGAWQTSRFTGQATERVNALTTQDLQHVMSGVDQLVDAVATSIQSSQNSNMSVANAVLKQRGGLHLDAASPVTWSAVNQVTQKATTVRLPRAVVGSTWLGQNRDAKVPTPVVDQIRGMIGGTVTIFQRMDAAGDLLRVATNVPSKTGGRAIGTYIPVQNADGTPNAVAAAIRSGTPYRGVAQVVGTWYVTAYDPIKDGAGRVIGATYVGVPQTTAIAALSSSIKDTKVGKHGSVWVVSTATADRGRVIVSTDSALAGQTELTTTDARGHKWLQETLARSEKLDDGAMVAATYRLPGTGGAAPAASTVYTSFHAPFKWAMIVRAYDPDFASAATALADGRSNMLQVFLLAAVILGLAGGLVSWIVARRMSRRIGALTQAITALADRNLTVHAASDGHDEIATMSDAVNTAVGQLHELLGDIRSGAHRIADATRQLSAAGDELLGAAEHATDRSASAAAAAEQITGNMQTVSAASEQMGASINEISHSAQEAADVARQGVTLAGEVNHAVVKLSESSDKIADVVKVIAAIAEQTNLLALNATIEAARAGEAGKGFAVVANEVKELAQQTAKATENVGQWVAAIKADTDSAVHAIGAITETVGRIDDFQTAIAAAVEEQTATTSEMARNVTDSATGSGRISESLQDVVQAMGTTRTAVEASHRATDDLGQTAATLTTLVDQFTM